MNRNELKTIAEGFKRVRPTKMTYGCTSGTVIDGVVSQEMSKPIEMVSFQYQGGGQG